MQSKPTPIPALSVVPRPTFVVGTDTEVGKTYQACRLVQALGRAGKSVGVYKPVLSGVVDGAGESGEHGSDDGSLLLQASGQRWPFARVCPQVFAAPVAPPVAARLEAKQVDESMLVDGLHWWSGRCDALVVEGAGGVLSPISETMTILDLAATSSARIIIVAANRLGVVNHTLLTLEAVRSRNLEILGVVLNEIPAEGEDSKENRSAAKAADRSRETNLQLLKEWENTVPISLDIASLVSSI